MDGLVDDHEVVADRQEVVADRRESLGKRSKILFLFVMARCVFTGLGYCRRERWSLCGLARSLLRTPRSRFVANA